MATSIATVDVSDSESLEMVSFFFMNLISCQFNSSKMLASIKSNCCLVLKF